MCHAARPSRSGTYPIEPHRASVFSHYASFFPIRDQIRVSRTSSASSRPLHDCPPSEWDRGRGVCPRGVVAQKRRAPNASLQPRAHLLTRESRLCGVAGGTGRAGLRGHFFPHFAPPTLTWGFVVAICVTTMFGLAPVEECGVQWGAVE